MLICLKQVYTSLNLKVSTHDQKKMNSKENHEIPTPDPQIYAKLRLCLRCMDWKLYIIRIMMFDKCAIIKPDMFMMGKNSRNLALKAVFVLYLLIEPYLLSMF